MLTAGFDEPAETSFLPELGVQQVERAHSWPGGRKDFSLRHVAGKTQGHLGFPLARHRRATELQQPCAADTWI